MKNFESFLTKSKSWEIELTTRCNSFCVGCSRFENYYYPNTLFNNQLDLSLENLSRALSESKNIESILMCGVYGDPLLHANIFGVLDVMSEHAQNAYKIVHTNASFGNEEFWKKLATYFKRPGSHIKFCIDGKKESHEKFRRGTNWEKILSNAKIFIEAGGNAVWKMIDFDHNHSEIEEMQNLSIEMGFKKFELRKNNYGGLHPYITLEATVLDNIGMQKEAWSSEKIEEWNLSQIAESSHSAVACKSLEKENLYLDVHGSVWPCCWVGSLPFRPEDGLRGLIKERVFNKYEAEFNNLNFKSLKDILSHEWFASELEESWQENGVKSGKAFSTCLKTCGKCS